MKIEGRTGFMDGLKK